MAVLNFQPLRGPPSHSKTLPTTKTRRCGASGLGNEMACLFLHTYTPIHSHSFSGVNLYAALEGRICEIKLNGAGKGVQGWPAGAP